MLLAFPMVLIPLILVERIKIIKEKVKPSPYGLGGRFIMDRTRHEIPRYPVSVRIYNNEIDIQNQISSK
jgi:hypothetical protein